MLKCVNKEKYPLTTFLFSQKLPSVIFWGFLSKKKEVIILRFTMNDVDKFTFKKKIKVFYAMIEETWLSQVSNIFWKPG